jgi:hypothetical protein
MASTPNVPKRSFLIWLGDHLFAAVLAFFVALAFGLWIGTSGTTQSAPPNAKKAIRNRVHMDSWPDRISAWTVVLASASTRGQAETAAELARRVPTRGLNLGVLRSNDYVDLTPGYWVAFVGQFDTAEEAQEAADRYRPLFTTTYQRFIEEK